MEGAGDWKLGEGFIKEITIAVRLQTAKLPGKEGGEGSPGSRKSMCKGPSCRECGSNLFFTSDLVSLCRLHCSKLLFTPFVAPEHYQDAWLPSIQEVKGSEDVGVWCWLHGCLGDLELPLGSWLPATLTPRALSVLVVPPCN